MKNLISTLIILTLILASCGSGKSTDEKEQSSDATEASVEETKEGSDFKEAKDCDEFVDQYEEWMDNYLEFLEKYMKNPMDAVNSQEYMKLAQEGMNWASQWSTKLVHCGSKEKYQKRFDEISEKADKKMKELGLE
jgi:hypothetical protein